MYSQININFLSVFIALVLLSCSNTPKKTKDIAQTKNEINNALKKPQLNKTFKDYWYAGKAEISSYKLQQVRYGELREGNAVLIYVTEDFLPKEQVKADNYSDTNIPVLKLNATKTFNTGIYPYSIMQSTFYPVTNNGFPLKISSAVQEWCGHVYTQLNNINDFEIRSHSYFQGEADQRFNLKKTMTENSLWTQLRIDPKTLPTGPQNIIPSFEYTQLKHIPIKAYNADTELENGKYTIHYPDLNRTLIITFNPNFPYDILSWEETVNEGFGSSAKQMTTKAIKLKTIKSSYWEKNKNKHHVFRDTLKL